MKKSLISLILIFNTISPINIYAQTNQNYTIENSIDYNKVRKEYFIHPLVQPLEGYFFQELNNNIYSNNWKSYDDPLFVAEIQTDNMRNKKTQIILGILIMLGMCVVRSFITSFPKKYLPMLTILITMLLLGILGVFFGWSNEKIFMEALVISTSAGGLWSLIGKHVLNLDY